MEARSIATPPSNSLPPGYRGAETISASDTASLVVASILIILATAALIYARIPKTIQHSFSLKLCSKVPCHRCQYFSHNPYLKCALHPESVLTEQAVDCQDYRPNRVVKWVEK